MSRKENLKKYCAMLHNVATKSSNEEVEVTELPTTPSSFEGIFPDTLEEEEEEKIGGKYLRSIFPDTLDD